MKETVISWKVVAFALWGVTTCVFGVGLKWIFDQEVKNGKEIARIEQKLDMTPLAKAHHQFDEMADIAKP